MGRLRRTTLVAGLATAVTLTTVPAGLAQTAKGPSVIRPLTSWGITTAAGDGIAGYAGDGGPAASAGLDGPGGVMQDGAGNQVIADTSNNVIRVVAGSTGKFYGQQFTAGDIYTVAGVGSAGYSGDGGFATGARLSAPEGVSADSSGNLVIADTGNDVIRVVAGGAGTFYGQQMNVGDIYTVAGEGTAGYSGDGGSATVAELSSPGRASVDGSGNLVIADSGNDVVRVVAATTGTFYGQAMTAGDIYTVAGDGTAGYVGDGGPATGAELNAPDGVTEDTVGDLIIADSGNDVVRVVAATTGTFYGQAMTAGDIYTVAGQAGEAGYSGNGPAALALLSAPRDISTDSHGNLVVADTGNDVVRVIATSTGTFYGRSMTGGDIYTVAGDGTAGYSGDGGPAINAQLTAPQGAAAVGSSTLLIADTGNNRIRMAGPGAVPQFNSGTSSTWYTGSPGSFQVTATGTGAISFTETGALPAGVAFSSPTGLMTGTPAAGSVGTYPLTITATGVNGKSRQQSFTLTVDTPCTTTVAANIKVGAKVVTKIPVTSLPACLTTVTQARPADIGASLVRLVKTQTGSGGGEILVQSPAAFGIAAGATVNFTPVIDGTVTCTGFTGALTFNPPLRNHMTSYPKETIKGKFKQCEIQATPPAGMNSIRTTAHDRLSPDSCIMCFLIGAVLVVGAELLVTDETFGLAAEGAGEFSTQALKLAPPGRHGQPPTESLLPTHLAADSAGFMVLGLDGPQAPQVSGSFAGPDQGAGSTITLPTSVTPAQFNDMAASATGIRALKLVSGSMFLG